MNEFTIGKYTSIATSVASCAGAAYLHSKSKKKNKGKVIGLSLLSTIGAGATLYFAGEEKRDKELSAGWANYNANHPQNK